MKDPLANVTAELRAWLTPELIAAVGHCTRGRYQNIRIQLIDGCGISIHRSAELPQIDRDSIVVDPTQPWPPQPVFEFGDKVTASDGQPGIAVAIPRQGDVLIAVPGGSTYTYPAANLEHGWPDEN